MCSLVWNVFVRHNAVVRYSSTMLDILSIHPVLLESHRSCLQSVDFQFHFTSAQCSVHLSSPNAHQLSSRNVLYSSTGCACCHFPEYSYGYFGCWLQVFSSQVCSLTTIQLQFSTSKWAPKWFLPAIAVMSLRAVGVSFDSGIVISHLYIVVG